MELPSWTQLQNVNLTNDNSSYMAYVGWDATSSGDKNLEYLFSEANLTALQRQVADALVGVDPQGRKIMVALDKIANVLTNVYQNVTRTRVGDIYSRYVVPQDQSRCDLREVNNVAVNIIVRSIRDEYETIENNKKLTVWTTVLGDFNKEGLRSHPPIKIRRRHPQHMAFNMNY
jgi:hypothetical protein